jgi:hypothetical protein
MSFNRSRDFDLVVYSLPLDKLSSYSFSTGYGNRFYSYLMNTPCYSYVTFLEFFYRPSLPLSRVPQCSVLGFLLFSIYINHLCRKIKLTHFRPFDDHIKNV